MKKYRGVFPALYTCYDPDGHIDPRGVRYWTNLLCEAGVGGIYVNGLPGEYDALTTTEKMTVMENVMAEAAGRVRVISRVTCGGDGETRALCRHAAACGVDGVAVFADPEGETAEETLKKAGELASLSGECDLILGPGALPTDGEEFARFREEAAKARVRGVLLEDARQLQALQEGMPENVSLISVKASMGAYAAFSRGLDALLGRYEILVPETAVRLESSLRYAFSGKAMQDQALLSALMDTLDACDAPLDAARALLCRLKGADTGRVRQPLPRMSGQDREAVEKCVRVMAGRAR